MLDGMIKLVTGTSKAAAQYLGDRQARAALERMLVLELRFNLDVLELLPRVNGERLVSEDPEEWAWRLGELSTSALESWLSLEAHPLDTLGKQGSPRDDVQRERHFDSLVSAASFILIRIRQLRVIASAPDVAHLPDIQWVRRHENLTQAHRAALIYLRESR